MPGPQVMDALIIITSDMSGDVTSRAQSNSYNFEWHR